MHNFAMNIRPNAQTPVATFNGCAGPSTCGLIGLSLAGAALLRRRLA
jgi:hypothetical protein